MPQPTALPATAAVTVEVNDLRLYARHGVLPQERELGTEYSVTMHLRYPAGADSLEGDSLEGTLNYARAVEIAAQVMATPSQLLEHVAARLVKALLGEWPALKGGKVRVAKLTPPIAAHMDSVAVCIEF